MHTSAAQVTADESDLVYELRERIRQLEAHLGKTWLAPVALGLTPSEQHVLGIVVQNPRLARYALIYDVLYGTRIEPPTMDLVTVFMCKIRRKLARHGIEIKTMFNTGYFITPDNLAKLKALYAPGERQPDEETP